MAYTTQAKIEAKLPPQFLTQALDDDGDGSADSGLLDQIISVCSEEIDGILGQRFDVPFTTVPSIVASAALTLCLYTLYVRRGLSGDQNPFEKPWMAMEEKLQKIARGDLPLEYSTPEGTAPAKIITEDAKTHRTDGGMIF